MQVVYEYEHDWQRMESAHHSDPDMNPGSPRKQQKVGRQGLSAAADPQYRRYSAL